MKFDKVKRSLGIIILCLANITFAANFDIQLSRDKINVGETVTLSFNITGSATGTPDFSPLDQDFYILSKRHGTYLNMFNGVTSTQTIWELTLQPKRSGELIIPEITFGHDKSYARKLLVESSNNTISTNDQETNPVFIKAEVSNLKPYIQSQVLYKVKVFYRVQLENLEIDLAKIKDAMMIPVGDSQNYQTSIGGHQYFVAEKNFALFPQKTGIISIPQTRARAVVFDQGNSLNYPFFINQPKSIHLNTESYQLNVQKPTDAFKGNTWLPAKNISISEDWSVDTEHWEAGNPVVRTIKVKAEELRADQIPDLVIDKIADVNIYVDPPKRNNDIKGNNVIGTLEQKVTYIPNSAKNTIIPPLKLDWWNTQTNTSAIAQLSGQFVKIKAKPFSNTTQTGFIPQPVAIVKQPQKDISTKIVEPFYGSLWFWLAVGMLGVWLITLGFLFYKFKNKKNEIVVQEVTRQKDELSLKKFAQACKQGDANFAQQFLLAWGKKQWPDVPLNLEKIRQNIGDENFKSVIQQLEETLYANKAVHWDGTALLSAYKQVQKKEKSKFSRLNKFRKSKRINEKLPPLNPN